MMDHIRQRDWGSTRSQHNQFVEEHDMNTCVIEKIIQNKFWDPLISSDEEEPVRPIDWDSVFYKTSNKEQQYRLFVPGHRKSPFSPKLSALTQDEQKQMMKVLCAENKHVLPTEYLGRPIKADIRLFEEKKEIYAKEQEQFIEWAKHLWITTNCIRALRPKPLVETVYEAEFKMKSQMMQCFPKAYKLAAQIPLKAENHVCEMLLPKSSLIKANISKLPKVSFSNINEVKESILQPCAVPEPCLQHPCKFILPYETESSILKLSEINKELAQYALDNGAEFIASESSFKCLLETDRSWCLPLSVCEVLGQDGDTINVVVLGSEFPERKEAAPIRSYRAFRHLLLNTFTAKSRTRTQTDRSDSSNANSVRSQPVSRQTPRQNSNIDKKVSRDRKVSTDSHRVAVAYNAAMKKMAEYIENSDDSDYETRLEIVLDDTNQTDNQDASKINEDITEAINNTNGNVSIDRKILKARRNTSNTDNQIDSQEGVNYSDSLQSIIDKQLQSTEEPGSDKFVSETNLWDATKEMDSVSEKHDAKTTKDIESEESRCVDKPGLDMDQFDISLKKCVCKGSKFELPSLRSYKNIHIKNFTTKEQINVIIHNSHKLKNNCSSEVLLEPILEYQLDIGGTMLSPQKIQSLSLSLMLRKNAELAIVRVDGTCGEVVSIETCETREWHARHGDHGACFANTLYTVLNQLVSLRAGDYLLKHEPSHGANALLFSPAVPSAPDTVPLQSEPLSPLEEAKLVQQPPRLGPVLLPYHKFRRQLPLAFTYNQKLVAKETSQAIAKKKTPPAAIQWPKKKGRKGKKGKK